MKTNMNVFILMACISATIFSCSSIKKESEKSVMKSLAHTDSTYIKLDRWLNKQTTKGFKGSVYMVSNGDIIIDKPYGQQDTTLPLAYWIASNSKPIVGLAILKLEEDKKLSVQDPITKYFQNVPSDKQHITIHHLLTHSSGLPHGYATDNIQTYEKALEAVMKVPVNKEQIGMFEYSNNGYALLVLLIEKLTGKTYERFVEKAIFKPADLEHTGFWGFEKENVFIQPPFDSLRAAKQPATMYDKGKSVINYGQKGSSGIYSTAKDQYKIFIAMMNGEIISKANVEKSFKPYVFVSENEDIKTYYAYGWFVGYRGNQLINIRHSGEETWLGHNSMRIFYPNGDGIVVLSNSNLTEEEDVWAVQVAYNLEYLLDLMKQ
ncbi:serine hydrolase domain-containing protein [Gillisia limnaea]|nr:serine hydrolase domain-containing protein [Gillisia limnaea]